MKEKPTKPFAIMTDRLEVIQGFCYISKKEREVIASMRRPHSSLLILLK